MKKALARYLLDVSKLSYAGLVITAVVQGSNSPLHLLIGGGAATLTATAGFILLKLSPKNKKKKKKSNL